MNTYIIAEAGVNHNGSLDMALQLVDVAAKAGADAVKFQTFKAERLVSHQAPKAEYQQQTTDSTESQFEMLRKLELDEEAHIAIIAHCTECGIEFLSTPFDLESVDLLAGQFNLPCLKIPSGEVTNAPFLLKVARSGKPVLLSTGMCTLADVEAALEVLAFGYTWPMDERCPSTRAFREAYCSNEGQEALLCNVTLLHCTTEYPAPLVDVNLRAMDTLQAAFGLPVGFSDHTEGIAVSVAAAARGAVVIEKHFTLDRKLPGPDHKASLEPVELLAMVQSIREVEQALGSAMKMPAPSEIKNISIARKCLVAARRITQGERFTESNLTVKRAGNGISPLLYWEIIGRVAGRDYQRDEMITP
jgi:N-acetylneuraminate synthase